MLYNEDKKALKPGDPVITPNANIIGHWENA